MRSITVDDGRMSSLQAAVDEASPGTEILVSGAYTGRLDFNGVAGEPGRPVTVRAVGSASITSSGTDSAVFFRNSAHIDVIGLVLDGGGRANAVVGIGGRYGDKGADGSGGPAHHLRFSDNEIRNSGQELVKLLHDSSNVEFIFNRFHSSGRLQSGKYGEAIYIGSANSGPDRTHAVQISNNEFHDLTAEAVDIKSQGTYDIEVRSNVIHSLHWPNYGSAKYNNGAIAVGQQRDGRNGDRLTDLGYTIVGNWIWDVSETSGSYQDAAGIQAWSPATIVGNVVFATDNDGIEVRDSYAGSSSADRTFVVRDNVVWGTGRTAGVDGISSTGLQASTIVEAAGNAAAMNGMAQTTPRSIPPDGFDWRAGCW